MPAGIALSIGVMKMGNGFSAVVAWQTVVPIVTGAMAIFMAKWLSHAYAERAQARTVRVVARMRPRNAHRSGDTR
jgi:phosphate/sulfate permease